MSKYNFTAVFFPHILLEDHILHEQLENNTAVMNSRVSKWSYQLVKFPSHLTAPVKINPGQLDDSMIIFGHGFWQNQTVQFAFWNVKFSDSTWSFRLRCSAHISKTTLLVCLAICSKKVTQRRKLFFSSISIYTQEAQHTKDTTREWDQLRQLYLSAIIIYLDTKQVIIQMQISMFWIPIITECLLLMS